MNDKMKKAWDTALGMLKPSARDLEHGLELHRNSVIVDAYGFGPAAAPNMAVALEAVKAGASHAEFNDLMEWMSMVRYVTDAAEQQEYKTAWDCSGVTAIIRNAGQEGQDPMRLIKRLAHFVYVTDQFRNYAPKAV